PRLAQSDWPSSFPALYASALILAIGFRIVPSFMSPKTVSAHAAEPVTRPEARPAAKYKRSGLDEDEAQRLAKRVESIMREERPYVDPSFSQARLAALAGVRTEWMSQVINQQLGKSFSQFVNGYRVVDAEQKLRACRREPNTLRIAHDVGFGSKSTFYRAFKAATGMTPRQLWRAQHGESDVEPR
ncbi:MAG: helix-turn-helix domain-containing protein, partial [Myxococcota bacterium]